MAKGIQDQRYVGLIQQLASARRDAKLSQAEVARRIRQPQQFVSKYESGERRLDVIEFIDVATALGIDGVLLLKSVSE